jgi:hypothetical protein
MRCTVSTRSACLPSLRRSVRTTAATTLLPRRARTPTRARAAPGAAPPVPAAPPGSAAPRTPASSAPRAGRRAAPPAAPGRGRPPRPPSRAPSMPPTSATRPRTRGRSRARPGGRHRRSRRDRRRCSASAGRHTKPAGGVGGGGAAVPGVPQAVGVPETVSQVCRSRRWRRIASSGLRPRKHVSAPGSGALTCDASAEVPRGWWSGAGSNRRPSDFQSDALPTELPDRFMRPAGARMGLPAGWRS